MSGRRRYHAERKMLAVLAHGRPMYGYEIMHESGFSSGTVYRILARFRDKGLLEWAKEEGDPSVLGRPLRTYYRLTDAGMEAAAAEADEYRRALGLDA